MNSTDKRSARAPEQHKRTKRMSKALTGREAVGEAILEIGAKNDKVVVLAADLAKSIRVHAFGDRFPGRFYNLGAAEQNMMGYAAGLSSMGLIPVIATYAMFAAGRALEQMRNSVAYPQANVKIIASHSGLITGEDGPTHQATEDIANVRAIPNMTILVPSDGLETMRALEAAVDFTGPVYLRILRIASPIVSEGTDFAIGKANVLKGGRDVSIIACGIMVSIAMEAAQMLENDGISARIINMHTIKPLDEQTLLTAAEETGAVVVAEDHNQYGGLGSAVAEVLCRKCPCPMRQVAVPDTFGETDAWPQLFQAYGLTSQEICNAAKDALKAKHEG